MKRTYFLLPLAAALVAVVPQPLRACTGITLRAADGTGVVARTIEWGGSDLNSRYVVVPRGYARRSFTPDGMDGMLFTARYGYVGLSVEREEFVAEGLNEEGLSAGLFYFPGYGEYEAYDPARKEESIADLQLVSLVLGACRTIDEVKELLGNVRVIGIDPRASTVHWRFADVSGRQVVLEIVDRHAVFYENELGVLTNSPGFEWQLTNLNNYVNLYPGSAPERRMEGVRLAAFGAVLQCFQILNNFDIPVGVEFPQGELPADIPSATQWTSATDPAGRTIYYRTMYDSTIRSIDLRAIDFGQVRYRSEPLDEVRRQPVVPVRIG